MKIRFAEKQDMKQLKMIWKLCFGDEDRYIDFYFECRNWIEETVVLELDGVIVSMQTIIPVENVGEKNDKQKAAMLFAIATHPNFQKRGFAEKLMDFSNQHLLLQEVSATILVPASVELFGFYSKRGYKEAYSIREKLFYRADIEKLSEADSYNWTITDINPNAYNEIRRENLRGHSYVDYRDDEILFQKKTSQLQNGDVFAINTENVKGCAIIQQISWKEIIIKELLLPEKYLISALSQISISVPCEKYVVRTPAFLGETLGGEIRHFAMLRGEQTQNRQSVATQAKAYLGIAFD